MLFLSYPLNTDMQTEGKFVGSSDGKEEKS